MIASVPIPEYINRLQNVLRVLDNVERDPVAELDMERWVDAPSLDVIADDTPSCAIGHCCRDEWFIEHGLFLIDTFDGIRSGCIAPAIHTDGELQTGYNAVRAFFCLTWNQAVSLFSHDNYHPFTPDALRRRIRKHINELSKMEDSA